MNLKSILITLLLIKYIQSCSQYYTIKQGDICYQIAATYSLTLNNFLSLNPGINCYNLQIGQQVCVKGDNIQYHTVVSGDLCYLIAAQYQITLDQLYALNPGLDCYNLQIGQKILVSGTVVVTQYHTVVSGDLCYKIAAKYQITLDQLYALNPGLDCYNLKIGQVLIVKGGSSTGVISYQKFVNAVTSSGYPTPSQVQYNNFIGGYQKNGGITTNRELAMFLAQILHESGGLIYKEEIRCKDTKCPNEYRNSGDDPNKFYYGRGYIQLTWSDNYRAASLALYGDERLVTNPDQVAYDDNVAWQTAFWYWKSRVHPNSGVQNGQFGSSTNLINGPLECNPCKAACTTRFVIYGKVLIAFGITEAPNNAGC